MDYLELQQFQKIIALLESIDRRLAAIERNTTLRAVRVQSPLTVGDIHTVSGKR